MAIDDALLEFARSHELPVLRFYGWSLAAASFGYSQHYADVERWTLLRPLVRRPTGGGLVPHDRDWTYSVVVPPTSEWYSLKALASYRRIHEWLHMAFSQIGVPTQLAPETRKVTFGQCFVGAEQFDLLWKGKKIAGAAQRRNRLGLLIQGSVQPPPGLSREIWQRAMCEVFKVRGAAQWQIFEPSAQFRTHADALVQSRYSQDAYNRRR